MTSLLLNLISLGAKFYSFFKRIYWALLSKSFFLYGYSVSFSGSYALTSVNDWKVFRFGGTSIAFRSKALPESVIQQIERQARHDPTISSPHFKKKFFIVQDDIIPSPTRSLFDAARLYAAISWPVDIVICIFGVETFASDKRLIALLKTIHGEKIGKVLVIVSDTDSRKLNHVLLSDLGFKVDIIFWPDYQLINPSPSFLFATFLVSLRPKKLINFGSRLAFETILQYSNRFTHATNLYCVSPKQTHVSSVDDFIFYHLPQMMPYARIIVASIESARTLEDRWGEISPFPIAVVPYPDSPLGYASNEVEVQTPWVNALLYEKRI